MNDDPRHDELDELQALAASAAIDDAADADERALVDSSPALQAWVESYGEVRAEMARVDVPPAARASALGAALAAFDELFADAATATTDAGTTGAGTTEVAQVAPAPVVSIGERAARRRWNPRVLLGAAAALVAVLAVGSVAVNLGSDRDDDGGGDVAVDAPMLDATDGAAATEAPADEASASESAKDSAGAETMTGPAELAPAPGEPTQTIGSLDQAADVEEATGGAPADTQAPSATEAPDATMSADAPFATIATGVEIADPDALIAYVEEIATARTITTTITTTTAATTAATTAPDADGSDPADTCSTADPTLEPFGYILYGPDALPATVVVDRATGEARALALEDCRVLVVVRTSIG